MFGRLPSLSSLRTFEAAARLKSFKAAAQELNVSPTAVSHQVRALEDRLQLSLFERRTRAVVLTREGEQLAAAAYKALSVLQDTVDDLSGQASRLGVGTTSAFAALWLVRHLQDFHRRCPDIDVQMRADDALGDVEHDRRLDLVVRYGRCPENEGSVRLLYRETVRLYATAEYWHRLCQQDSLVVLQTEWKNPHLPKPDLTPLLAPLQALGKPLNVQAFDDENQVVQAALAGQGMAVCSQLLVALPVEKGWLQQAPERWMQTGEGLDYYVYLPRRSQNNRAAERFVQWLSEQLHASALI